MEKKIMKLTKSKILFLLGGLTFLIGLNQNLMSALRSTTQKSATLLRRTPGLSTQFSRGFATGSPITPNPNRSPFEFGNKPFQSNLAEARGFSSTPNNKQAENPKTYQERAENFFNSSTAKTASNLFDSYSNYLAWSVALGLGSMLYSLANEENKKDNDKDNNDTPTTVIASIKTPEEGGDGNKKDLDEDHKEDGADRLLSALRMHGDALIKANEEFEKKEAARKKSWLPGAIYDRWYGKP